MPSPIRAIGMGNAICVMKNIIAKIFGLITPEKLQAEIDQVHKILLKNRREFYQSVLEHLHRNGTLPPNCDLKMPKESLRIVSEKGEVLAEDGKWKRLPNDGEPVTITYKKNE